MGPSQPSYPAAGYREALTHLNPCEVLVLGLAGVDLTVFIAAFVVPLFWVCGENSIGDTPMFWLLLTGACTASRLSLRFPLCPLRE